MQKIDRREGQAFCPRRSVEHYDNVQCRVGIHCTLGNRPRSLPGLRNKQAREQRMLPSLSVLSLPPSFFVSVHPTHVRPVDKSEEPADFVLSRGKKKEKFLADSLSKYYLAPISLCTYLLNHSRTPPQRVKMVNKDPKR